MSKELSLEEIEQILEDPGFDIDAVRSDFAYLQLEGQPVIYLDNAATTQRPNQVIDRVAKFYREENANPLRGNHRLSILATQANELGREKVREFINAKESVEVLFTRNATESLNLVSTTWGMEHLKEGDEVLITRMEHHSNSVNWQFVCQQTGANLRYIELNDDFGLDMEDFEDKLNEKTKVLSFTGASNVLSTVPDAKAMIKKAREFGALTVVDGAQLTPHEKVDVQDMDCDFFAFSGHKMLAPFGIGVLYGKRDILENMRPFLYGGEMIEYVYDDYATFAELPYKFEAGTQNVGGVVGLHAAIDYMENIGLDKIERYEKALGEYCAIKLKERKDIELYHPEHGPRGAAVAFNIKDVHPHDVSTIMDFNGIAIRSGHHCTQQLHKALGQGSSCRVSFSFYNTREECDAFLATIDEVNETMGLGGN